MIERTRVRLKFWSSRILTLPLMLLTAWGCDPTPGHEQIQQGAERWADGLNSSSIDRIARVYEEGGVLLLPGEDAVVGRDRIRDRWEQLAGSHVLEYESALEEMREDGRVGFRYGTYTLSGVASATGESFQIENGFMQIWRRQRDGRWLLALDMWYPRDRADFEVPGGEAMR